MKIAARLKDARASLGLTQEEIVTRSGIPMNTYRKYELGLRRPQTEQLQKLAALGIDLNWLITGVRFITDENGRQLFPYPLEEPHIPAKHQESAPMSLTASEPPTTQPYAADAASTNADLLGLCLDACRAVHGERFSAIDSRRQLGFAVDFYDLLTRLAGQSRQRQADFEKLTSPELAVLLDLLIKLGWAKRLPLPNPFKGTARALPVPGKGS